MPRAKVMEQQRLNRENLQSEMFSLSACHFFLTVFPDESGRFRGEINNPFYEEAIPFDGLDTAILQMNKMMDDLGYPQTAIVLRDLCPRKAKEPKAQVLQERERRYQYYLNKEFLNSPMARTPQIQIEVLYRQNVTWQGTVLFALPKNPKQEHFRSVLELMNIIKSGYTHLILPEKQQTAAAESRCEYVRKIR